MVPASVLEASLLVDAATLLLGAFGVIEGARKLPRFFRYREIRRFFRFGSSNRVLLVCSELEDTENRQWVEPTEFIYLLKYGDVDALVDLALVIKEVYPNVRLDIMSARETANTQMDFDCDVILIGGPDYNLQVERLLRDNKTSISYHTPDWDSPGADSCEIALSHADGKKWSTKEVDTDFGYVEVLANPYAHSRRIFVFGGCHTIGVTAAARVMQLKRKDTAGLTPLALQNLKRLNRHASFRASYGVVFPAALVGASITSPTLEGAFFFGSERKLLGLSLDKFATRLRALGLRRSGKKAAQPT